MKMLVNLILRGITVLKSRKNGTCASEAVDFLVINVYI
jgi:hypothetical protein